MTEPTVSLIIPAFNEAERIGAVLEVAKRSRILAEIIVVDDGSTDKTGEVAESFNVRVIRLPRNSGKGTAMAQGLKEAMGEIILFLDADLTDLKEGHIQALAAPLLADPDLAMTLGVFTGSGFASYFGNGLLPHIAGQRGLRVKFFPDLKLEGKGYGSEIAISKYVIKNHLQYKKIPLPNLHYVFKEQKTSFGRSLIYRFVMYFEMVKEIFS
jgi:glycosyltransferase involved in cell wall biosynthesis